MPTTFQQKVNAEKAKGFTGDQIKQAFKTKYGVDITDFGKDDDYDAFRSDWEAKQKAPAAEPASPNTEIVLPEETIFVSPEELRKGLVENLGWAGITEESLKQAPPTPEPTATIEAAKPLAEEPWYKTAARVALPKAFGIEEGLLGPDPDTLPSYDKAKVEADIAKYRTIKPGEYEFQAAQLARPAGLVAGALAETGKLGTELGVQTAAAITGKDATKLREAWAQKLGLPAGMAAEALEPQATKKVFRALGGAEAIGETPTAEELKKRKEEEERQKLFPKPSLPVRAGEDIGAALNGLLNFIATDIIPVLPSPEQKGGTFTEQLQQQAGAAYKRGEEFPAGTAAFAPILVKAGQQLADGKVSDALDTIAEKPATIALSVLPMLHALGPNAPKAVVNWTYGTIGSALKAAGGKPAQWGATLARWFSDPVVMETDLKSAKSEAIYERGRSDAGKVREAVKRAVDQAVKIKTSVESGVVETPEGTVIQTQRLTPEGRLVVYPEEPSTQSPAQAQALADMDANIQAKAAEAGEKKTYGYDPNIPTGASLADGTEFVNFQDAPPTKLTYQQLQDAQQALVRERARAAGDIAKATKEGQAEIAKAAADLQRAQQEVSNLRSQPKVSTTGTPDVLQKDYKLNTQVIDRNIKEVNKRADQAIRTVERLKTLTEEERTQQVENIEAERADAINELGKQQAALAEELDRNLQQYKASEQQGLKIEQAIREQKYILNRKGARLSELEDAIADLEDKSSKLLEQEQRVRKERVNRENKAQKAQATEAEKLAAPAGEGVFTQYGRLGMNPPDTLRTTSIDSRGNIIPLSQEARGKLAGLFEEQPNGTWKVTDPAAGLLDPMLYELPATLVDSIVEDLSQRYPTLSKYVAESVDPTTGRVTSETINQFQRDLGGVIAKGVIDVLENQAVAALRDTRIVDKVARKLVDSVQWDSKQAKALAYERLTTALRNNNGDMIIELPGLEPINPRQLAIEINKVLMGEQKYQAFQEGIKAKEAARAAQGLPPVTDALAAENIPPQMKKAILDRVLPRVENEAFKQSLRESFDAERVQLPDSNAPSGFANATPENVAGFADQAIRYVENTGTAPLSVRVGTEQNLGLLLQELGKTDRGAFTQDAISRYVKPSAELKRLGFTDADYIDPAINSAYTSIIKAMDAVASNEDAFFGKMIGDVKRSYTSRNISSAMNNLKSNVLLFTSFYGLGKGAQALYGAVGSGTKGIKTIFDRYLMNEPIDLGKAGYREKAIFDGIRESGVIDSNAAKAEGILLEEGAGLGVTLLEKIGEKLGVEAANNALAKGLRYFNDVQDRFYQFGDQYYKFRGAIEETGEAFKVWDKLKVGDRATINFGKYGERVVEKLPNGEARYIETVYDSKGKSIGERAGEVIDERQLARVFAKEGARLAGDKFVDFKRVPQMVNWLKNSPAGIGGLASLFTTWYWKMMDIPLLKKGIVSHFIENPRIIKNVSGDGSGDAASYLRSETVKNQFGRQALFGIAQRYTYHKEDEKREKILQRVMNWEKGAMPTSSAFISSVDPFQAVYLDSGSANFLGPSDIAARVMASGAVKAGELGIKGYRKLINDAADAADIPRDVVVADLEASVLESGREQNYIMREMRRLYTEQKAGVLASPRELASALMLRGGGPLFDFTSVITNPKSTWSDVEKFANRTLFQAGLGGTNKRIFVDTVYPEIAARYNDASPAEKSLIYAQAQDKVSSYPFNPDRFGYPVLERFVDGLLSLGWKTAYISQYGSDGKTDIGKVGSFMRDYEKGLKNSLEKEYEQRYNLLIDAGISPDDPKLKELTKKYNYLSVIVDKQINAMDMRINEIFQSPKYRQATP